MTASSSSPSAEDPDRGDDAAVAGFVGLFEGALHGFDPEERAYALGQALFASGVPLATVLAAQRAAAASVLARHPDRAADLLDAGLRVAQLITGPYEQQLQQARDYHSAQRGMNSLLRQQAEAIERTNAELHRAREAADQATREKAMFLANMSHEIRTPLNAVVGLASLLADADLDDEHADHVRTIIGSADHLLFLINDILDFSKIEAGSVVLERVPFHLPRCIELALDMVSTAAADKGIELAYELADDVPHAVVGDEGRLRQVLVNLLSNAVKFSEGGEVVVEGSVVSEGPEGDLVLALAVRDQGIGIAPDRIGALFEPFTQADASTTRRFGGTGLGLAISRRLVELMGGELAVASSLGHGSTFSLSFRTTRSAVAVAPPPRFEPERLRGLELLVVDDNETNRRILVAQATRWGMRCHAFASAAATLRWLDEGHAPSVAILDHHMPEVDGVVLARRLRANAATRGLPLLLLSSATRAASDLGPDRDLFAAVLSKPIKQSALLDHVAAAVGERGMLAEGGSGSRRDGPPPGARDLRVLVAEDNPINQKVARRLLERTGYTRVHVVADGAEAVDALRHEPYDVILMDAQMPVMDGIEAARQIVALWSRDGGRPRIIALTAEAMPGDRERFLAAGMDDYLAKPVTREKLEQTLARCAPVTGWTPPPARGAVPGLAAAEGPAEDAGSTQKGAAAVDAAELAAGIRSLRSAIDVGRIDEARTAAAAIRELVVPHDPPDDVHAAVQAVADAGDDALRAQGVLLAGRLQAALKRWTRA